MDPWFVWLALAATCAASLCLYLAAPRQQWLARPWPAFAGRLAGAVLALAAMLLWLRLMHVATAIFTMLTLTMLCWVALPYLAAWRNLRRGR
ncbi:ABC-type branched-subunit amino acid transport system permease subunit [Janthinobacterium sp. CG_23.3]